MATSHPDASEKASPRQLIDPDNTLPEVWIEEHEDHPLNFNVYRKHPDDGRPEHVVSAKVDSREGEGGKRREHFKDVLIEPPELRGRSSGYGLVAYLTAIERAHERGADFGTHPVNFSPAAKRMWERLIALEVATVNEGFEPFGDESFSADIVVHAPETPDEHLDISA